VANSEALTGLSKLVGIINSASLAVTKRRRLFDRIAWWVEVERYGKKSSIIISEEYLSDLPNHSEFVNSATVYYRSLSSRMVNSQPNNYYCRSRVPIRAEIEYPFEPIPMRAGSYVHVTLENLRVAGERASCVVNVTHLQHLTLNKDPFVLEGAIVNTIRNAVDSGGITFHSPTAAQQISLLLPSNSIQVRSDQASDPRRYLAEKVYWLGFRQGDKRTWTWVEDPWDSDYLHVALAQLAQFAQILEARDMIVLDRDQQFARAGQAMLRGTDTFEEQPRLIAALTGEQDTKDGFGGKWDFFICHASEDKDDFVRPLVTALQETEKSVWFDEFTLSVGDSLRQSIDRGLAGSRYGVVVLSPSFFAKHWPQRELDGLAAREVAGVKVILPVWYRVTRADVCSYSPTLADRVAALASEGPASVAQKLLKATTEAGGRTY
jgi:TIR domain